MKGTLLHFKPSGRMRSAPAGFFCIISSSAWRSFASCSSLSFSPCIGCLDVIWVLGALYMRLDYLFHIVPCRVTVKWLMRVGMGSCFVREYLLLCRLIILFIVFYLFKNLVKNFIVPVRRITIFVQKKEQFLIQLGAYIPVSQPIGK